MTEPHQEIVGMTPPGARSHLERHGLVTVVSRRDGEPVSGLDLTTPGQVFVAVHRGTVVGLEGRT